MWRQLERRCLIGIALSGLPFEAAAWKRQSISLCGNGRRQLTPADSGCGIGNTIATGFAAHTGGNTPVAVADQTAE